MSYTTPGALRAALEARMASREAATVPGLERLRRRTVFEWVLKGGMALEVRLGDRARSTRDLDLAVRQAGEDAEAVRDHLIDALATDPEGDGFEFRVGPAKAIDLDEAGRAGWRFAVDARLDGRTFANVRLDVVSVEAAMARRRPFWAATLAAAGEEPAG